MYKALTSFVHTVLQQCVSHTLVVVTALARVLEFVRAPTRVPEFQNPVRAALAKASATAMVAMDAWRDLLYGQVATRRMHV